MENNETFRLRLNGPTMVIVDWANVYRWQRTLGRRIEVEKIISFLRCHKQIANIHFFIGIDENIKSKQFADHLQQLKIITHTKPVKYIKINNNPPTFQRKCNLDVEMTLTTLKSEKEFSNFVFFSGDGDFAALYKELTSRGKQVVVIYAKRHVGKELWSVGGRFSMVDIENIQKKASILQKEGGKDLKTVYKRKIKTSTIKKEPKCND